MIINVETIKEALINLISLKGLQIALLLLIYTFICFELDYQWGYTYRRFRR